MPTMKMLVKGLNIPDMDRTQTGLWNTWLNITYHDDNNGNMQEPERVDHVHAATDSRLHITTSMFIDLHRRFQGDPNGKSPCLQIITVWEVWDETPDRDTCDIYADPFRDRFYREVEALNVYRTVQDDPGGWSAKDVDPADLLLDYLA